jgi:hypothetical protein
VNAFIIECQNKPGEIARVSRAVADKGINITSSTSLAYGNFGAIGLLTEDEAGTRDALDKVGMRYHECEVVKFTLPDEPGTLAEASQRLGDAGVNVEILVPTAMGAGEVSLAAGVDNAPAARQALGKLVAARA